jgi:hypothetical protein
VIDTFISRPTWVPQSFEPRLVLLYEAIERADLRACTVGITHAPIRSPFDDVCGLMKKCRCAIILGMPHLFIESGRIKHGESGLKMTLATEWNQIEAAVSLALGLPTLVLLHQTVADRGLFSAGAANVFIHRFDLMKAGWIEGLKPKLIALRSAVDA